MSLLIKKMKSIKFKSFLALLVLFVLSSSFVFSLINKNNNIINTNAAFGFCDDLGYGLNSDSKPSTKVVLPDATNRKWTIEELFSNSLMFTTYNGEGDIFNNTIKSTRGEGYPLWDNEDVQKELHNTKNLYRCLTNTIGTVIPNFLLHLSEGVTGWTKSFTTSLFSTSYICSDPANPEGNCINLLAIVGGTGKNSDGGVIGMLTSSIYMPLTIVAIIFTTVWIMWIGLIKREFRKAFSDIMWSVGAFVFGIIALYNPSLLAKAPQAVNNVVATCLVSGLNGQSCLDSSAATSVSTLVGDECLSNATVDKSDEAELVVNSLNCSIWKTFVLDSWSNGQFGRSYFDLYTQDAPSGSQIWNYLPDNTSELYCVNLTSTKSANSFEYDTIELDTGTVKVCNIALYHLYVKSGVWDTVAQKGEIRDTPSGREYFESVPVYTESGLTDYSLEVRDKYFEERFYNIIGPATQDEEMWRHWAPSFGFSFARGGSALLSLITSMIAGVSLIIFSIYGHIYNFSGTVLMTLAPLFLLFAIHPTRGKKMFLGWVEMVLSSILKYMASAFFILIALVMYAAILKNTSGPTSFIGVIILAGVLFMYRKEVVNMMSSVSMGGTKTKNVLSEKLNKASKKAGRFANAGIGGAIGGMVAGGNAKTSAAEALSRELRRGNNVFAQGAQQWNKVDSINRREAEKESAKNSKEEILNEETQSELNENNNSKSKNNTSSNSIKEDITKNNKRAKTNNNTENTSRKNNKTSTTYNYNKPHINKTNVQGDVNITNKNNKIINTGKNSIINDKDNVNIVRGESNIINDKLHNESSNVKNNVNKNNQSKKKNNKLPKLDD